MRRLFWFVAGMVSGIYATLWARRTAEEMADRLSPSALLDQVLHVLKSLMKAAVSGAGFLVDTATDRASGSSGTRQDH